MIGDIIEIERAKYFMRDLHPSTSKMETRTTIQAARSGNPVNAGSADDKRLASGQVAPDVRKLRSLFARLVSSMSILF